MTRRTLFQASPAPRRALPRPTSPLAPPYHAARPLRPRAGTLFNWPTQTGEGLPVDVYADCRKDYTGNDVTAANLLAVLQGGNTSTGGPTLSRVTANDRVFVNFVDHGAAGECRALRRARASSR